jgi:hypothetical protein
VLFVPAEFVALTLQGSSHTHARSAEQIIDPAGSARNNTHACSAEQIIDPAGCARNYTHACSAEQIIDPAGSARFITPAGFNVASHLNEFDKPATQ